MDRGGKVFGVVVGDVDVAGCPKNIELSLFDAVADPIETHVHGSTATLFDDVIGYAVGACIVRLDRCWWLRVSHGNENVAQHDGVFGVVEECAKFGFGG